VKPFAALCLSVLAAAAVRAPAAEIPGALVVLETAPGTPASDPSSAPPRFVLLKDGQVFVGGTARLAAGRLEKPEAQALRKRVELVRKAAGRAGELVLGGGERVCRLRLPEETPAVLTLSGDPESLPAPLSPAAEVVLELLRFHHPSLAPYAPASYALGVREGKLAGGCRRWSFPFPIEQALGQPRLVPAADATGWPTGGLPASVCSGDRRYVVTLRPLLPGEQP
jgi:hypothetical protein